jgi:hypothetical protein
MARTAKAMGRQPANRRRSQEAPKKIGSLPRTRQDKVLDIRRQLTEGTYEVAGRLDIVMDRVLEAWFR